jgi:WD40 repeat protein
MIRDQERFIETFASCISESAPHIYLSALSFAPCNSLVLENYTARYLKRLRMENKGYREWPAIRNVLAGHENGVDCVAFSRDGKKIVSGSWDKTIRIWNAETGGVISGPFKGHKSGVNSVMFSPDGNHIVSGSHDKTVCVWDVETGQVIPEPFKGHEDAVTSVAFSPNGSYIVSGSFDGTIRLWSVETGQAISRPYRWCHICHILSRWMSHCFWVERQNNPSVGCKDWTGRVWAT